MWRSDSMLMAPGCGCESTDLRVGDWMQTYTGKAFWILDPRPEDVCIEDIAHHLAAIGRFNGASKVFYSVGQHSLNVANIVGLQAVRFGTGEGTTLTETSALLRDSRLYVALLMHDAHEAYTQDIIRPHKNNLPQIKQICEDVQNVIWQVFGLLDFVQSVEVQEIIRTADARMLATERRDLMAPGKFEWHLGEPYADFHIKPSKSIADVESAFLKLFEGLMRDIVR